MKYILSSFLLLFFSLNVHSQNELKNWYFGTGTDGITFVNNVPQKLNNKISGVGYEGMVVVNDPLTGNLLFYSDGIRVVDKTQNIMANGSGLNGNTSGAQSVQSCPVPGTCAKQFYLFTNSAYDYTAGKISYSIIDFTANPLGTVINKNTLFWNGPSDQGMCLVNKPNTNDYWLIANSFKTATYNVWPLTASGIGSPLIYTFVNTGTSYQMNYDKVSKKLTVSGFGGNDNKLVTVIDFDANTGILSNEVQLASGFYGSGATRFSPDGTKLYAGLSATSADNPSLYQYDFNTSSWTKMNSCCYAHDLKLGPDGKMYFINTYNSAQPISVIDFPNLTAAGNACNYHTLTFAPAFTGESRRFPETVILPTPVTANPDSVSLSGSSINITVLANDTKEVNDIFILDTILLQPKYGTATINGDIITYTTNQNICGTDTFIYRIKNQDCALDTAQVLIKENNCTPIGLCSGATHIVWKDDFGNGIPVSHGPSSNINPAYKYQNFGIGSGHYYITNYFNNDPSWHTITQDHSLNDTGGYFLIIDGGSPTFYSTRIDGLCKNTTYTFSSWAMNIDKPAYPSLPTFIFKVLDTLGNSIGQLTTAALPTQATPAWANNGFTFNSGNNTSLNLSISFTSTGYNDFAFDDLEFSVCGPTLGMSFSTPVCTNKVNVEAIIGSGYTNPFYQWYKQDNNGIWQLITNANTSTYTDSNPAAHNWYKVTVQDGTSSCSYVEDSILTNLNLNTLINITIDTSICNGESYLGHTVTGAYTDTLKNIAGCDSISRTVRLTVNNCNLTCDGSLGNPVVNETFGAGLNYGPPLPAGSTSSLGYQPTNCPGDGNYAITNFTSGCWPLPDVAWHTLKDHTGNPNGYFMLVNASYAPSDFYIKNVAGLCEGTFYKFSSWIINMCSNGGNQPNITFTIEKTDGTVLAIYQSGNITSSPAPVWKEYSLYFQTPPGVSNVVLRMRNNAPGGVGNDLGLDDITFSPCGPKTIASFSTTNVSDSSICNNTGINLYGIVSAGLIMPAYQWQVSNDNGITFTDIPGANTLNYTESGLSNGNYRFILLSAEAGNIGSSSCRFVSDTINLTVTQCCTQNISFTAPDTVCLNTPVNIVNTSTCASSYYWSFCSANINATPPDAINLGNPGNFLNGPTFSDYVKDNNGNYYLFVTNFVTGNLVRLDFGNNILNNPTAINLGNFNGKLIPGGTEGIQVVYNENKWYALITVGRINSTATAGIVKIEFGTLITNTSPAVTVWNNIGNLNYPCDLTMFQQNGNWYGLTLNKSSNSITLLNFSNSFNNTPTGKNFGNIGNLDNPTGIYAVYDAGNWYAFITNSYQDDPAYPNYGTITRLDFGNSLLNTPTGTNLGNIGGLLNNVRDIYIVKTCGNDIGFVVNWNSNDLVKLDFHNNITSKPTGISLGNIGQMNVPHSISKFFRIGNDLYSFTTNLGNSITRFRFAGCSGTNLPNATAYTPPPVTYSQPGTYTINLAVDDSLPTQRSFCKDIVVLDNHFVKTNKDTSICMGSSLQLKATGAQTYSWLPIAYLSNPSIANPVATPLNKTQYFVTGTSALGCTAMDTINISINTLPLVKAGNDTSICLNAVVQLNAIGATTYYWIPLAGLSNAAIANPIASPNATTQYFVTGIDVNGCSAKDTFNITIKPKPSIIKTQDTSICKNTSVQLFAGGGINYQWASIGTINNPTSPTPTVTLPSNTNSAVFYVTVTDINTCTNTDSVKVYTRPSPVFTVSPDQFVCTTKPVQLYASGGDSYLWSPAASVNNAMAQNPLTNTGATTVYSVLIKESTCNNSKTLSTTVKLLPPLDITVTKTNDLDCSNGSAKLLASGANWYRWSPAGGLNDTTIANPVVSSLTTQKYIVKGSNADGCIGYDTVIVYANYADKAEGYYMPNAFTPNGDGTNDCYGIKYWGLIEKLEFAIYDRWGNKVFYTTNPADCWDGTYKGQSANMGGYMYYIKAVTACGLIERKGNLVLIR